MNASLDVARHHMTCLWLRFMAISEMNARSVSRGEHDGWWLALNSLASLFKQELCALTELVVKAVNSEQVF